MRILFVVPYYPPAWDFGGPVRACQGLAGALAARGHEVHVWTSDALDRRARLPPERAQAREDGVEVRRFPVRGLRLFQRLNLFPTPALLRVRASELASFDAIHLHEYRTFQNLALLGPLRRCGIPFVLTPHGSFGMRGRVRVKQAYDLLAGSALARSARVVAALTQRERDEIASLGVPLDRIRVLPNGVEPPRATPAPDWRARLGVPADARVVLFLGRLQAIKGPDLLLDAFAASAAGKEGVLVFAGPDEGMGEALRERARALGLEGRVIFPGPLRGEVLEGALQGAWVLAQPSRSEGQSMVLLEAMARGTPIVCTEACVFEEEARAAALVAQADARSLAGALDAFAADPEAARRRSEAGLRLARERYSWERVAARAESIYQEAIA